MRPELRTAGHSRTTPTAGSCVLQRRNDLGDVLLVAFTPRASNGVQRRSNWLMSTSILDFRLRVDLRAAGAREAKSSSENHVEHFATTAGIFSSTAHYGS
jgi:hypothetical protein